MIDFICFVITLFEVFVIGTAVGAAQEKDKRRHNG
jgi:hypothetical protein